MLFNTPVYPTQINKYQGTNNSVKQKQEEEKSKSSSQEKQETPSYNKIYHPTPGYYSAAAKISRPQQQKQAISTSVSQQDVKNNEQTQQGSVTMERQQFPNGEKTAIDYTQSKINISQVIKDFKSTTEAIGSPDDVRNTVYTYVSLVKDESQKEVPNKKIIQSNLKNASQVLDEYITKTLDKPSKVVEGWVDSLFLQNVDYKYDENVINPDYQVKLPEKKSNETVSADTTEKTQQFKNPLFETLVSAKRETNPAEALNIYSEVIESAKETNDNKALSIAYFESGKLYDKFDSLDKAIENYTSAIEVSDDDSLKAQAYMKMALIQHDSAQLKEAGENYFSSIAYFGQTENIKAQAVLLSQTGKLASEEYDKANAFAYFDVADGLAGELRDDTLSAKINQKAGEAFAYMNEPKMALDYYKNSASTYDSVENHSELAKDYQAAAKLMLSLGNASKARTLLNKAFKASVKADDMALMKHIQADIEVICA